MWIVFMYESVSNESLMAAVRCLATGRCGGDYNRNMTYRCLVWLCRLFFIHPEGSRLRRTQHLRRREYLNPGPNHCWYADGYDKLKPYGFPIHGCIDGFSRKILWLEIVRTNNDPRVVGKLFVDCVKELECCPTILRTDRGTENGIMASSQ